MRLISIISSILLFSTLSLAAEKSMQSQSTLQLLTTGALKMVSVIAYCGGEANLLAASVSADTTPGVSLIWKAAAATTESAADVDIDWGYIYGSLLSWEALGNGTSMTLGAASILQDLVDMFLDYGYNGQLDEAFKYTKANYSVTVDIFQHMFSETSACGQDAKVVGDIIKELYSRAKN